MEQNVEIVGVTGQTGEPRSLGGVTGISEFEEIRYTGHEWGFERLHAGEERQLTRDDVVEIMAFNGIRNGRESWSLLRIRAGKESRLTGPLSWRRVPNADRWSPAPVAGAIFTSWIKVVGAAFAALMASYAIFTWAIAGLLSGGLVVTLSSATASVLVIVGAFAYLFRSWHKIALMRRVARIQADGSIFVVGQPEGF